MPGAFDDSPIHPTENLGVLDQIFSVLGNFFTGGTEAENNELSKETHPTLNRIPRAFTGHHLTGSEFATNRFGPGVAELGGGLVEMLEGAFDREDDTALDFVANRIGRDAAQADPADRQLVRDAGSSQLNELLRHIDAGRLDPVAVQNREAPVFSRLSRGEFADAGRAALGAEVPNRRQRKDDGLGFEDIPQRGIIEDLVQGLIGKATNVPSR